MKYDSEKNFTIKNISPVYKIKCKNTCYRPDTVIIYILYIHPTSYTSIYISIFHLNWKIITVNTSCEAEDTFFGTCIGISVFSFHVFFNFLHTVVHLKSHASEHTKFLFHLQTFYYTSIHNTDEILQ